MFTGIVEERGTVWAVGGGRMSVGCARVRDGLRVGDSVSVNGACLTVTTVTDEGFAADVMDETLARTALGDLQPGAVVNLERPLRAGDRLGGHLVQGHVDAVAHVLAVETRPGDGRASDSTTMRFSLPPALAPYLVEKGSVTVDGTSLTVADVDAASFTVGLIPHTLAVTVLGLRSAGDRVNVEADVVAKYVERLLRAGAPTPYDAGSGRSDGL